MCFKCGYAYVERRALYRKEKAVNVFFFGGVPQAAKIKEAKIKDVSGNGVRIAYAGKPLARDALLHFKFEGSTARKSAGVVWSRRIGKKGSESGLRYVSKRKISKDFLGG